MFGVTKSLISKILGAKERTARVAKLNNSTSGVELSAAHEQVLRKAPKPLQDKIAEVVLIGYHRVKSDISVRFDLFTSN